MRIKTIWLNSAALCAIGFFSIGSAFAVVAGAEMPGRVKLSGVPDEKVTLRSGTAPVTSLDLAPTAKQLEMAAASSKYAQPKTAGLAAVLGIKAPPVRGAAPRRVGPVFPSGADARVAAWESVKGGQVTHFRITSSGAKGIRAKLVVPLGLTQGELRVVGQIGDIAAVVPLDVAQNGEIWTPYTDGETQIVELFSTQPVDGLKFKVESVGHFEESPFALKDPAERTRSTAAGTCTVDVACPIADDPLNGAAISERRKSVARMLFVSGGQNFLCTGTLINSPAQQDFFLTANHCISTQAEAASLETRWFYEASTCGGSVRSDVVSVSGGATLVFTNQFVDSTLLRLNLSPPPGAVFAGWNSNPLAVNSAIVSLSHPKGDLMKAAIGTVSVPGNSTGLIRLQGYEQQMYGILFTRGIIEGGSSGSGLFTLSNGSLQLRGVLSSSTTRNSPDGQSCTDTNENVNYGRFDYFYPQIASILNGTPVAADDAPNQPSATAPVLTFDVPKTATLNYVGDIDSFRINVAQAGTLYVKSAGGYDLIGGLLDANGATLESTSGTKATDDDADVGSNDFGITWQVTPGTYYLNVAPWVPTDLTPNGYSVTASFTTATTNYTSLWWGGASESGWGMNLNHQGNIIFGTLFTYDAGQGIWLILSRGERQADGSYLGALYQTTGPAFNAIPFTPITTANLTQVGNMRLTFSGPDSGTLVYDVRGRSVTKAISKQTFGTQPTCTFSGTNRTFNDNYQDLWWNPNESGWGINLTHQSDIIFGTLFTYDAAGKGMWLILSRGDKLTSTPPTQTFAGALYRTTGPNFDAVPFSPIGPSNLTQVGNMRLEFANGNSARLIYDVNGASVTKNIERQTFDPFRSNCEKP